MRLLLPILLGTTILAGAAQADDLALTRVMLSSAGVGYFEYEARVDGPGTLGLDVKLDQVDDVLKSLVVFDDAGAVGGLALPGRDQERAAFGDVPFGPDALTSQLAYLNSLQGVELTIAGARPLQGRLLRAETVRAPDPAPGTAPAPDRTRVTLLTAAGLQQFVLEDSDAVQVTDPGLRARIAIALAASRRQAGQDVRRVTLHTGPGGARAVRVGFVAAAPLWKASYRLLLPAADGTEARLQGWATLENTTGADWPGIALSLQYGNPVTFHQALYRSYFVTRPEVPVEVLGRILPDVDTRARAPARAAAPASPRRDEPRPAPPPPPSPMFATMEMAAPSEAAEVQEGVQDTSFAIAAPLALPAGHSASVPFLDRTVPARRVWLAPPDQPHPLATIELTNDTQSSLPAGVLTLYGAPGETPFAGDARLGGLPRGETRLIAFAQDLRTGVETRREDRLTLAGLTAANGVLTVTRRTRQLTRVTLTGPATEARSLLVEARKTGAATIAPGFARPASETATAWRFAVDLAPGATKELVYALDRDEQETVALLDDADAVDAVLTLPGAGPEARAALGALTALRAREAELTRDRDQLAARRADIERDEARLRANLGALQPGDALRTRLLRQLDADETTHRELSTAIATAQTRVTAAHEALAAAAAGVRF